MSLMIKLKSLCNMIVQLMKLDVEKITLSCHRCLILCGIKNLNITLVQVKVWPLDAFKRSFWYSNRLILNFFIKLLIINYTECLYSECHYVKCHYFQCHYVKCHYVKCHYDECHYVKCHYDECHYAKCWYVDCFLCLLSIC